MNPTLTAVPPVESAVREVIAHLPGESFRFTDHDYPSPLARWNYHPEYEIHLIRHGTGNYIIGDRVGQFSAGHVAIVGPGLPHDWMSNLRPDETIPNRDAVVQFTQEWFDGCCDAMPELHELRPFLEGCARGVVFTGATAANAATAIDELGCATGANRAAGLLGVLCLLAEAASDDWRFVTSSMHHPAIGVEGRAAVEAGLAYILENLTDDIRMSEAARIAMMSEPTFSRYFKRASGLTFSHMVRRLRVANACRMLTHTDWSVGSVCSAVGYSNLSNFTRQFRAETGVTPREFRAQNRWPAA